MEKSTSEASRKSNQATSKALPSAISSVESQSGAMLSDLQVGPMTDLFGREVVLAPVSVPQEKAKGLQTLVTSGRIGIDSSASAALQSSLESRLMQRLDTAGSTLFKLTWKRKVTPLGRRYLERAASALRTAGSDCTSWPSPNRADHNASRSNDAIAYSRRWMERENHGSQLAHVAQALAACPTPNGDDANNVTRASGEFKSLTRDAQMASWATPISTDADYGMENAIAEQERGNTRIDSLVRQTSLLASGETPNGSGAGTGNGGQLNPAHSRWLQGLPKDWDVAAIVAHRSIQMQRRKRG